MSPTTEPPVRSLASIIALQQRRGPHDLVGQEHGERFVADEFRRHPDGVAEAERLGLVDEPDVESVEVLEPLGQFVLAGLVERRQQVGGRLEELLDRVLARVVDDDHRLDPGADRLFDDELESRDVDQGQQLLGNHLGERQEPRTESRCGDDRLAYTHGAGA